jgi:uncharacterized membrane protein (DUF106 family)
MTASDILYVASTVAVTQAMVDLLANKMVFSTENYSHRVSTLERMRVKRDKALASPKPVQATVKAMDKYNKKIKRAEEDYAMAASNVAQKHTLPKVLNSIVFIFLYRILSMEYGGRVIAILPYEPWGIIRRFSMRGLSFADDFDWTPAEDGAFRSVQSANQACGFLFIYVLCNMSVKFMTNKFVAKKPPSGTEKGFLTFMDDPRGQKILNQFGVDTEEINEMRKQF